MAAPHVLSRDWGTVEQHELKDGSFDLVIVLFDRDLQFSINTGVLLSDNDVDFFHLGLETGLEIAARPPKGSRPTLVVDNTRENH